MDSYWAFNVESMESCKNVLLIFSLEEKKLIIWDAINFLQILMWSEYKVVCISYRCITQIYKEICVFKFNLNGILFINYHTYTSTLFVVNTLYAKLNFLFPTKAQINGIWLI